MGDRLLVKRKKKNMIEGGVDLVDHMDLREEKRKIMELGHENRKNMEMIEEEGIIEQEARKGRGDRRIMRFFYVCSFHL